MTELLVHNTNVPQPIKLSDGKPGYLSVKREGNHFRYFFKFEAHEHHDFWYDAPALPNDLVIKVASIDGLERFKIKLIN
ncbi:MAG: hypothetical protein ABF723_11450 [Lentilactobacillus hilgardii]|uniref:hypothetical protein n=2 Tax=Lentilactobacillus hilgardii TaxID=1588 RepID=UPI001CC1FBD7|nr:hypothetical protein [Lentilactobacillus hilgardii]MBZ2199894.1 hypothetical protein [Lentilactobacillus hilgardii]MBZ2203014.1 hypothetical protein [Lentilactobacillus hilgardii]